MRTADGAIRPAQDMSATGCDATQTRVLLVEDIEAEGELIVYQLRRASFDFSWRRVENEPALRAALQEFRPTIVLSDFSLPRFEDPGGVPQLAGRQPDRQFPEVAVHDRLANRFEGSHLHRRARV